MKIFKKEYWQTIEGFRGHIKMLAFFVILTEITKLASPYILKLIIDKLTTFQPEDAVYIVSLIGIMFLSGQFVFALHYFKDKLIFKCLINNEYFLSVRSHKKLVSMPLSYHEKESTGNKLTKIERGISNISRMLSDILFDVAPTLVQLIITFFVLLIVDWRFGLTIFIFAPLFIWFTYKVNKDLRPTRKKRFKEYEKISGIMGESIININTVKSFSMEEGELSKSRKLRESIRKNEIKEWFTLLFVNIKRNITVNLGRSTILLLGVFLVWQGEVTIGTLVFVITLSEKTYMSLFRISGTYDRVQNGSTAIRRLLKLFNHKSNIINPENGLKPKNIEGIVKFKNVSFTYNNSKEKALNKMDLKINAGCFTALVGPSGGGKTTIARMIYRHYDPQKGEILLDKKNLKDYDIKSFRKFIAIVPQEVEIFNTSIKENISYANPRASFQEVQAAARIANAEEFIKKLSKGYNTLVGERGIKLSGGQRQRIGIARAILANPRILIFDEATSNLDSYSEKLIQEAIDKIRKGRTMIVIAHRLSTIKKADKIIVIENGRVVEEGGHNELARTDGGLYAKLLKLQKMGDVD